uniref:Rho-GAP domain-containing protein n=1 Tax=Angiostrongylus cantonensis TaxID=6313 RepID=A0A158P9X8_ANGCA
MGHQTSAVPSCLCEMLVVEQQLDESENKSSVNCILWTLPEPEAMTDFEVCSVTVRTTRVPSMVRSSCGPAGSVHRLGNDIYAGAAAISSSEFTVHDVCSMVKRFFRDLKEPLLSHPLLRKSLMDLAKKSDTKEITRQEFCTVFELGFEAAKKGIDNSLSPALKGTLGYLMRQLHRISNHSTKHQMDAKNLATVFAPTLFRDGVKQKGKRKERRGTQDDLLSSLREDTKLQITAIRLLIEHANWIGLHPNCYITSTHHHRSSSATPSPRPVTVVNVTEPKKEPLLDRKNSMEIDEARSGKSSTERQFSSGLLGLFHGFGGRFTGRRSASKDEKQGNPRRPMVQILLSADRRASSPAVFAPNEPVINGQNSSTFRSSAHRYMLDIADSSKKVDPSACSQVYTSNDALRSSSTRISRNRQAPGPFVGRQIKTKNEARVSHGSAVVGETIVVTTGSLQVDEATVCNISDRAMPPAKAQSSHTSHSSAIMKDVSKIDCLRKMLRQVPQIGMEIHLRERTSGVKHWWVATLGWRKILTTSVFQPVFDLRAAKFGKLFSKYTGVRRVNAEKSVMSLFHKSGPKSAMPLPKTIPLPTPLAKDRGLVLEPCFTLGAGISHGDSDSTLTIDDDMFSASNDIKAAILNAKCDKDIKESFGPCFRPSVAAIERQGIVRDRVNLFRKLENPMPVLLEPISGRASGLSSGSLDTTDEAFVKPSAPPVTRSLNMGIPKRKDSSSLSSHAPLNSPQSPK